MHEVKVVQDKPNQYQMVPVSTVNDVTADVKAGTKVG